MQNVEYRVEAGKDKKKKLIIEVDLTQEHGLSKSEKSINIGTTNGNQPIGDGVYLSVNCYKKNPEYAKA